MIILLLSTKHHSIKSVAGPCAW